MNKQPLLRSLLAHAGKRKWLTYASMVLVAVSQLLALMPFVCIWFILRDVLTEGSYDGITHYGWMAVAFAIGAVVVYLCGLLCSHTAAFRVAAGMRKKMMQHVMTLPIGSFNTLGSGRVRKWVQEVSGQTETYLAHQLPDKAGMYATMGGLAVMMFLFDWRLGLLCILTAALALWLMMTFMTGPTLKKKMNEYGLALDAMSAEAVEYVRGMPVVKTFGQSVHSFHRLKDAIANHQRWVIDYTISLRIPMTIYTVLINASFAVLIGATLIVAGGGTPSREFLLNLLYYIIITPAISVTMNRIMFASENEMLAEEARGKIDKVFAMQPLESAGNMPVPQDIKQCSLNNVKFRYPNSDRNAVDGISLSIPAGAKVAFVGSSGGGKTTLACLIARFFDVNEGSITLGGVDLRSIGKQELMNNISFVFQNSRLLKTSILENVRMGRPEASREEVLQALHRAQCDTILSKLPDGVDTIIGSRGIHLSGGEQQRIAIARVMLKDTPIVIIDEATAFADAENESHIQQAFSAMTTQGKTLIMIAHRLSSVVDADLICLLDDGRIVEQGTHQSLMAKGGRYATAWKQYSQTVKWNIK